MPDTIKNSTGCWIDILSRLGIDREMLRNKHGPCPVCGGKDRFRFDDKDGSGSWICSQCGSGLGMDLAKLYTGREFKEIAADIDKMQGVQRMEPKPEKKPDPAIRLNKIRSELIPDDGTIAAYLAARGITVPLPKSIKLHPYMPYYDDGKCVGRFKAMVSMVTDIDSKPVTYHVTYLDGLQKAKIKAPKKMLPGKSKLPGSSVKMSAPSDYLSLAEGIETALAVSQMTPYPVAACLNSNLLESIEIPETIKHVTIWGDNDANFTGQKSAYALANKLKIRNPDLIVRVLIPEVIGQDWNDVLIESGKQ